jgi:hypothetical protein
MVNQELVNIIIARFQAGDTKENIVDSLIAEGWSIAEIDGAITYIQRQALLQLPFIAKIRDFFQKWDGKTSELSPRTVMLVSSTMVAALLVIALGLFFYLDPFGNKNSVKAIPKEEVLHEIHDALDNYYAGQHIYPSTLDELVPTYLKVIPPDPENGKPVAYTPINGNTEYELCIDPAIRPIQCINSASSQPSLGENQQSSAAKQNTSPYSITGSVFLDSNNDGKKDSGEGIFTGAPVIVKDTTGKTICESQTNQDGVVVCQLEQAGNYTVTVVAPETYKFSTPNPLSVTLPDPKTPALNTAAVLVGVLTTPTNLPVTTGVSSINR